MIIGRGVASFLASLCVVASCPQDGWSDQAGRDAEPKLPSVIKGYGAGADGLAWEFWRRFSDKDEPRYDGGIFAKGGVRLCQFGGFVRMAYNDWEATEPVRLGEGTTETLPIQAICAELAGMDGQYRLVLSATDVPAFALMFWVGDEMTVLIYPEYDDRVADRVSPNAREAALIEALFRAYRSKERTVPGHVTKQGGP